MRTTTRPSSASGQRNRRQRRRTLRTSKMRGELCFSRRACLGLLRYGVSELRVYSRMTSCYWQLSDRIEFSPNVLPRRCRMTTSQSLTCPVTRLKMCKPTLLKVSNKRQKTTWSRWCVTKAPPTSLSIGSNAYVCSTVAVYIADQRKHFPEDVTIYLFAFHVGNHDQALTP